jgi:putative hemolysin
MELITTRELTSSSAMLNNVAGEALIRFIFRLLKFDQINKHYARNYHHKGVRFCEGILRDAGISFIVPPEDLLNIPGSGGFITVSNHAYGGIDGLIILKLLGEIRPDYKVLVNFLLTRIEPLQSSVLGVNPFENHKAAQSSYGGLKEAIAHIQGGHPLGIFPAGEVSSYRFREKSITDRTWQLSMLKFIRKVKLPVVPVYFEGHNSVLFNLLGMVHPALRTIKLPSELFNKQGKEIRVRIGAPISVREQSDFTDLEKYGRFLRMKTYALGVSFRPETKRHPGPLCTPEPVTPAISQKSIKDEVESLPAENLLFSIQENKVFCVASSAIPSIMQEIGRLRELTYRDIGEGTNKSTDIDQYDAFFEQLFIWDTLAGKIVGGYRVGKGDRIVDQFGIQGFYINSLFRIDPGFIPVLRISMELGRSFITKEYQKRPLSLFLLWKGIMYLLLKHPEYRYLIGPVSIPNSFRDISKSLCVDYLKENCFNKEFATRIHPRNPFRGTTDPSIDKEVFLKHTEFEPGRLDRFIQDFDPFYKTPILLKKYISVNAEALGFNIDPLFNNCLDALMILDIYDVPFETFESLSKEINDQSILGRFRQEGNAVSG